MPEPSSPHQADFKTVLAGELAAVAHRRRVCGGDAAAPPSAEAVKKDLTGLAFSGGGIRSASFCLGFLQGLIRATPGAAADGSGPPAAAPDGLARFDYLSTVSGGGYTGAVLSALVHAEAPPPQDPDDPAVERPLDKRKAVTDALSAPERGAVQPFWQRLLHRGQLLGQAFPFLSRHIVSTLVFNLTLLSGLGFVCCVLALVWRELDRPPLHTFLTWASNGQLIEFNRPFLIPAAVFTAYLIVVLSRRSAAWQVRAVAVLSPIAVFAYLFGLPFLMVLSTVLTVFGVVFTLFSGILKWTRDGRKQSQEFRRVVHAAAWLLALVALKILYGIAVWRTVFGGGEPADFALPYWVMVVWTAVLAALEVKWIIAFSHPDFSTPHARLDRVMLAATGLAVLTGAAVWLSTPNMRHGQTAGALNDLWSGPSHVLNVIVAGIVALLLPFFRLETVLRSGTQARSTTQRWVFNTLGAVLLLGVPFLFVSALAKHNLSGYADLPARDLTDGDAPLDAVVRRLAAAPPPGWLPDLLRLAGPVPVAAGPMAPADPAQAYDAALKFAVTDKFGEKAVPGAEDLTQTALAHDRRSAWYADNVAGWLPQVVRETSLAVPANPHSWKALRGRQAAEEAFMARLSEVIRDPKFVKSVVCDPAIYAWLQSKATELADRKGEDAAAAAWRAHGRALTAKLGHLRPHAGDPAFLANVWMHQDDAEAVGLLSFVAAYSDGRRSRPHGFVNRPGVIGRDQVVRLVLCGLLAALFLAAAVTIDLNWVSPLAYYSRRLRDAYLVPQMRAGAGDPAADADPPVHALDNTRLGLPYHLIGCSVDVTNTRREPRRYQEHFLVSAKYVGSKALRDRGGVLGFRETGEYRIVDRTAAAGVRPLRLSDVMAVSGAAVTPVRFENVLMRAILTVTNFRLGQWVPHPKEAEPVTPTLANVARDLPGVDDSMNHNRLVYVADGGFFDNLGLEALLDRRCATVVVVDAGGDAEFLFADLCRVLQRVELRGVRVTALDTADGPLDLKPLLPRDPADKTGAEAAPHAAAGGLFGGLFARPPAETAAFAARLSRAHFVAAAVHYPKSPQGDAFTGTLVYAKPTLTGDEPADVTAFRKAQPVFPHHSTAEQLFDWGMMNAYRRLGEHVARDVTAYLDAPRRDPAEMVDYLDASAKEAEAHLSDLVARLKAAPPAGPDVERLRRLMTQFAAAKAEIDAWPPPAPPAAPPKKARKKKPPKPAAPQADGSADGSL